MNFKSHNIPIESQLSTRTTLHNNLSFPRQSKTATFVKLNWCKFSHVHEQISNTSRRISRVYVLRSDFEQIRFQETKKEFPYTAAIVSINRCFLRELKQRRRRRQQERHKSNWFRLAKQQLCTCNTRFCTFFQFAVTARLRHETAYFTFFEGREHRTTPFYLFSWISIQLQKKLPTFDKMNEME